MPESRCRKAAGQAKILDTITGNGIIRIGLLAGTSSKIASSRTKGRCKHMRVGSFAVLMLALVFMTYASIASGANPPTKIHAGFVTGLEKEYFTLFLAPFPQAKNVADSTKQYLGTIDAGLYWGDHLVSFNIQKYSCGKSDRARVSIYADVGVFSPPLKTGTQESQTLLVGPTVGICWDTDATLQPTFDGVGITVAVGAVSWGQFVNFAHATVGLRSFGFYDISEGRKYTGENLILEQWEPFLEVQVYRDFLWFKTCMGSRFYLVPTFSFPTYGGTSVYLSIGAGVSM